MQSLVLSALLLLPLAVLQGCAPSGTDAATGERAFRQCASCHQVGLNARSGFGPQLNGLFGRRAGSAPDFAYSDAMKASGIVWNERTLAAFLHDPAKLVPGTKMRFWGIGDENEIKALAAYLRTFQDAHQAQAGCGVEWTTILQGIQNKAPEPPCKAPSDHTSSWPPPSSPG